MGLYILYSCLCSCPQAGEVIPKFYPCSSVASTLSAYHPMVKSAHHLPNPRGHDPGLQPVEDYRLNHRGVKHSRRPRIRPLLSTHLWQPRPFMPLSLRGSESPSTSCRLIPTWFAPGTWNRIPLWEGGHRQWAPSLPPPLPHLQPSITISTAPPVGRGHWHYVCR